MKDARRLWPGGPIYKGVPVQADALLLADFAQGFAAARCAELGCGDGVGLLLLAQARPAARFMGVELDETAAARARENLARNGLTARGDILCGDWRDAALERGAYDLVLANPPYFAAGRGAAPPAPERALARRETATLPALCEAAARALREGGRLCLIHRPERLAELCAALSAARLEPKRLRCVYAGPGRAPSLLLVEGRRGGAPGLRWEPPLLIRDGQGRETAEYKRISHWEDNT